MNSAATFPDRGLFVHLLIIDPQNDFCDLPRQYLPFDPVRGGARLAPGLPVKGAHADMLRLSALILQGRAGIDAITVTLDSHHRVGIERPALWRQGDGAPMAPFTQVRAEDVRAGRYVPRDAGQVPRVLRYLEALEAGGRYVHMVWPPHCELGTWGHNVHPDVQAAYNAWEESQLGVVRKVVKGSNPWTEHYSALRAEVPEDDDPHTALNRGLLEELDRADVVMVAGEAGSHCVKATLEHVAEYGGPAMMRKFVLLRDCMSPVMGFETQQQDMLKAMSDLGARVTDSVSILPELLADGPTAA
jgi:nicotinamidase-related amidase